MAKGLPFQIPWILLLVSLTGVSADDETTIGIILGCVGGSILLLLIVLVACILCRPSKEKSAPSPRYPPSSTEYRNGSIPNGGPRGAPEKPPSVPPGVWTSNPTMFVGVPSPAYGNYADPPKYNGNGVNGRIYTSNPDLANNPDKKGTPIRSQPDLNRADIMRNFSMKEEEPNRRRSEIVREVQYKLHERGNDGTARIFSNYSDIDGPTSSQPATRSSGYHSEAGDPFVARILSDYSDPKDAIMPNSENRENVARVYNNYPASSSPPQRSSQYIAKAIVRNNSETHEVTAEELDAELDNDSAAVFIPHSDWDIVTGPPKPSKPVTRTQSHMERGFHNQPRIVGPGDVAPHDQGFMGMKSPYSPGVVLNRSPSDAVPKSKGSAERKGKDKKDKGSDKGSGKGSGKGSDKGKGSGEKKKWWSRKPGQARAQSAEVPVQSQPAIPVQKQLHAAHLAGRPVQRSMSDSSSFVRPVSPQYQARPQSPLAVQSVAANFDDDTMPESPLYAHPAKIKQAQQKNTKPVQDDKRQLSPGDREQPPPLPHRTTDTNANQVQVTAVIEKPKETASDTKPDDTQDKLRQRHMSVSSESSIGFSKAGKVVSDAFEFLDSEM